MNPNLTLPNLTYYLLISQSNASEIEAFAVAHTITVVSRNSTIPLDKTECRYELHLSLLIKLIYDFYCPFVLPPTTLVIFAIVRKPL